MQQHGFTCGREWLTCVYSQLWTVYTVLHRGIRNTARAFLEYMPVHYARSERWPPYWEEGSKVYVNPSRDLRGPEITIVARIRKSVPRETKVRRDLHVGSGISRHLHRLFASSPVINSPAVAVTLSSSYIHTYTPHLFNSRNYDLNLRTEIYLREDRRPLIYHFFHKSIILTILLTFRLLYYAKPFLHTFFVSIEWALYCV